MTTTRIRSWALGGSAADGVRLYPAQADLTAQCHRRRHLSQPAAEQPCPPGSQPVQLDLAEFSTEIDHPYWPMKPGTRWTYRE